MAERKSHPKIFSRTPFTTGKGCDILPVRPQTFLARIKTGRGKDPQDIIQGKEGNRDRFHPAQKLSVLQRDRIKGPRKRADQIDEQHGRADHIIALIDRIVHHADGYHLKNTLAEIFQLFSAGFQTDLPPLTVIAALSIAHRARRYKGNPRSKKVKK